MTARYMSRKQVAEYIGKSVSTVDRWTERGALPMPTRPYDGADPMWDREAIDRKLDRRPRPAGRYTDPDEAISLMRADRAREAQTR